MARGFWRCSGEAGGSCWSTTFLATGGTLTAAADLCLKAGYEVAALGALIDLHIVTDYRWRGMPLRAVIDY